MSDVSRRGFLKTTGTVAAATAAASLVAPAPARAKGSKNLLMFRSGTLGYHDFTRKAGTENYGGIRPGCWINALPVGGLVLVPDASAGCSCSYQNRSWVALEGVSEEIPHR